jgi:hypothetical protein
MLQYQWVLYDACVCKTNKWQHRRPIYFREIISMESWYYRKVWQFITSPPHMGFEAYELGVDNHLEYCIVVLFSSSVWNCKRCEDGRLPSGRRRFTDITYIAEIRFLITLFHISFSTHCPLPWRLAHLWFQGKFYPECRIIMCPYQFNRS